MFPNSTQKSAVLWDKFNSLSSSYSSPSASASASSSSSSSPSPSEHQSHLKRNRRNLHHYDHQHRHHHQQFSRDQRSFKRRSETRSSSKFIDYLGLANIGNCGQTSNQSSYGQSGLSELTRRLSIRASGSPGFSQRFGFSGEGVKSVGGGSRKLRASSIAPSSSTVSSESSYLQNFKIEMTRLLRSLRQ